MYRDTKYKRLEVGRFRIPVAIIGEGRQVALVSAAQLAMILEGIEPVVVKKRKRFRRRCSSINIAVTCRCIARSTVLSKA